MICCVVHDFSYFSCQFQFNLDNLVLSDRARKKMIEIAGLRYNSAAGTIQLVGKRSAYLVVISLLYIIIVIVGNTLLCRCPTRKQNHDYVMYLLKVLYLESNVRSYLLTLGVYVKHAHWQKSMCSYIHAIKY